MQLRGDATRYGPAAALLHWTSAGVILLNLALGFAAARSTDPARTAVLLRPHLVLGLLVLALSLGRLLWWQRDHRPEVPPGPRWQSRAARTTHLLLYGLVLLLGLSGIALAAVSGAVPILFGSAPGALPNFGRFAPMAGHALGAFALAIFVALHIGAALYHQFVRRDRPFSRMPLRIGRRGGLA